MMKPSLLTEVGLEGDSGRRIERITLGRGGRIMKSHKESFLWGCFLLLAGFSIEGDWTMIYTGCYLFGIACMLNVVAGGIKEMVEDVKDTNDRRRY